MSESIDAYLAEVLRRAELKDDPGIVLLNDPEAMESWFEGTAGYSLRLAIVREIIQSPAAKEQFLAMMKDRRRQMPRLEASTPRVLLDGETPRRSSRGLFLILGGIVAVGVLVVLWWTWPGIVNEPVEPASLDLVEKALEEGEPLVALRHLQRGLATWKLDRVRRERLMNRALQMARGEHDVAISVEKRNKLTDFGLTLMGTAAFRGDAPTDSELGQHFEAASKRFPASRAFRLNYADWLTRRSVERIEDGRTLAKKALDVLEPLEGDVHVWLARGIAHYFAEQYDKALEAFAAVLALDSDNQSALLNSAITYQSQDRPEDARVYWKKLLDVTTDEKLIERVERLLEQMR